MDKCENCGNVIGALETPSAWKDHVVCRSCHDRLSMTSVVSNEPLAPSRTALPESEYHRNDAGPSSDSAGSRATRPLRTAGPIIIGLGLIFSFTLSIGAGNVFIGLGIILWIVGFAYGKSGSAR